ncbi:MAG TPA: hypothetical protein VHU40_15010 [Polyangia bacterium]|nr:hypothetical protein [Polyangia bacterium]
MSSPLPAVPPIPFEPAPPVLTGGGFVAAAPPAPLGGADLPPEALGGACVPPVGVGCAGAPPEELG